MPDPDYKALCEELVESLENARRIIQGADGTLHINTAEFVLRRARAALAQPESAVVPVPVSDRLPGPENKTTDDECWFWDPISGCWFLLPGPPLNDYYTHWLPHHSLPIPRSGTH